MGRNLVASGGSWSLENGSEVVMARIAAAALGGDFPTAREFGVDRLPPGLFEGAER